MAPDSTRHDEPPHDGRAHDVLAAEEFGMPAPDPRLHRDEAHDVLAAEEFVVPAPDPSLHHGPVTLPADPTGIAEPHDVLAAEEFALPAPRGGGSEAGAARAARGPGRSRPPRAVMLLGGALGLGLARRRRRRRSA
jgi:hypothetical protein